MPANFLNKTNTIKIGSIYLLNLFAVVFGAGIAFANPILDNVAAGDVSVKNSETTTQVNQSSDKAIINWQSFNINPGEKTQFVQPTASSPDFCQF